MQISYFKMSTESNHCHFEPEINMIIKHIFECDSAFIVDLRIFTIKNIDNLVDKIFVLF